LGDPTGSGNGGESIFGVLGGPKYFQPEIQSALKHKRGTVSMAAMDDASGTGLLVSGSQFFITLGNNLDYLDGKHAVFGEVAEGWDVLDKMSASICDSSGRPLSDILVRHTIILHDPFPDPKGMAVLAPPSPLLPSAEQQQILRVETGDSLDPAENDEAREQRGREQEAKAQALTLEMIGDLPYADVKPPENVLFVCKLNPVTRDGDLETIFARFGRILSCDIIRDRATGDSLGYAFIEFGAKEACEEAYFKMDNVLIDDRRIHVDFSQSVSRVDGRWVRTKMARGNDIDAVGGRGRSRLQMKRRYRDNNLSGESRNTSSFDFVFDSPKDHSSDRDGQSRARARSRWDEASHGKISSRHNREYKGRRSSKSPDRTNSRSPDSSHHHHHRRSRFDR
ncbi:Peptidyl-prolyl cis-trans isomerase-like 4, partial [Coemansia sp. BCRC 34490]